MSADDAQRELEQRALRNVRGLVERIEEDDVADRRTQRRILLALVAGAALVGVLFAGAVLFSPPPPGRTLQLEVPRGAAKATP